MPLKIEAFSKAKGKWQPVLSLRHADGSCYIESTNPPRSGHEAYLLRCEDDDLSSKIKRMTQGSVNFEGFGIKRISIKPSAIAFVGFAEEVRSGGFDVIDILRNGESRDIRLRNRDGKATEIRLTHLQ